MREGCPVFLLPPAGRRESEGGRGRERGGEDVGVQLYPRPRNARPFFRYPLGVNEQMEAEDVGR